MKSLLWCGLMCTLVLVGAAVETCNDCNNAGRCVQVDIQLCANTYLTRNNTDGFSLVHLPNRIGHRTQGEIEVAILEFLPLIKTQCSPYIHDFVCSIYAPKCESWGSNTKGYIEPCRDLCEKGRSGCVALMNKFGFPWPDALRCDQLPESGPCLGVDERGIVTVVGRSAKSRIRSQTDEASSYPGVSLRDFKSPGGTCAELDIPMCKRVDVYSNSSDQVALTHVPNLRMHGSQEEAHIEINQFIPLVETNCSPHLIDFLCSVYAPRCVTLYTIVGYIVPCRSLCEESRQGCQPLLNDFGFHWPDTLSCDLFPESGTCTGVDANGIVSVINLESQHESTGSKETDSRTSGNGSHVEEPNVTNESNETGSGIASRNVTAGTGTNRTGGGGGVVVGDAADIAGDKSSVYTEWLRSNIRVNNVQLKLLKEKVAIAKLEREMMKGQVTRRERKKKRTKTNQGSEEIINA